MYCSPEQLLNPFDLSGTDTVARTSRRTDMYAFGILSWEIMTQKKPFADVKSEAELGTKVHQGHRPPIEDLPSETPPGITEMIESCWSRDRMLRPIAIECHTILKHYLSVIKGGSYDIFFSHAWKNKPLLAHVYADLVKHGYRVWYDMNDMGYDLQASMKRGIANSSVVLICANSFYQSRTNCMFELNEAHATGKRILTLVVEENPFDWANEDILNKCQLKAAPFADIGHIAKLEWDADDGPTDEMITQLKTSLLPLYDLLLGGSSTAQYFNKGDILSTSAMSVVSPSYAISKDSRLSASASSMMNTSQPPDSSEVNASAEFPIKAEVKGTELSTIVESEVIELEISSPLTLDIDVPKPHAKTSPRRRVSEAEDHLQTLKVKVDELAKAIEIQNPHVKDSTEE
jgi:serine/threonine protein kinase